MTTRRRFLTGAAMALIGAELGRVRAARAQPGTPMPSLAGTTTWLNSSPLTADGLRGKVVLVQFWTYTCINWLRSLPYVRAWAETYKDQGLVVIGVHSPEFPFEKDVESVRQAARTMRIAYPIAVDSDHAVWRAFKNEYWPALYFVDTQGQIRHQGTAEPHDRRHDAGLRAACLRAGRNVFEQAAVAG